MLTGHIGGAIILRYILNYAENSPVATYASGPYIFINGKRCIDTSLGNGTHILGHKPEISIYGGTLSGIRSCYSHHFGELLHNYAGFDSFVLCNTGAEATMRAARIARAYTGRDRIAMFEGCWHGGSDIWLDCPGIPEIVKNLVVKLPYNESSLDILSKEDFAMVIIEPVPNSLPIDNKDFLKAIGKVARSRGTLFCLDEIVTGFRLARGGAKELFGIDCDLATYGKIAGGGFPIGIVGGKLEIMKVVDEGVTMGGTFSGNPATLAVGIDVLAHLTNDVYEYLDRQGERLRKEVKFQMCGVGSKSRVLFTDVPVKNRAERDLYEDPKWRKVFYEETFKEGIYIGSNGIQFLSVKHTPEIVQRIIDVFNNIYDKVT